MTDRKYTADSVGDRIDDFLSTIIDDAGFDLEFEVSDGEATGRDFENPEVVVRFFGDDVELLLANRAELLLALEYLTMESLSVPHTDHDRICFDANEYRALRIEELRMSAQAAAERVKASGRPYEFGAMTSRERRIIHLALRHDTDVRSESEGMGSQRHAVIYPAEMPSREPRSEQRPRKPFGRRR